VSCAVAVSCANAGIEVIATATNAEMAARVDVGLNRCIEAGKRGFVHAGVGWLGCGGHVEDSVRGRSPSGRRRTENAAEITKLGPPPFSIPLNVFLPCIKHFIYEVAFALNFLFPLVKNEFSNPFVANIGWSQTMKSHEALEKEIEFSIVIYDLYFLFYLY